MLMTALELATEQEQGSKNLIKQNLLTPLDPNYGDPVPASLRGDLPNPLPIRVQDWINIQNILQIYV